MKEYTDREAAIKAALKALEGKITAIDAIDVAEALEDVPAADVVEVVRCKDCKHYRPESRNGKAKYCCSSAFVKVGEMDFCSYWERSK